MKLIEMDTRTKLPVLPDELFWRVSLSWKEKRSPFTGLRRHVRSCTLELVSGTVSQNSFCSSNTYASRTVSKQWHWLVRLTAIRIYRKRIKNGELVPGTIAAPWDERYNTIRNYRLDNGRN